MRFLEYLGDGADFARVQVVHQTPLRDLPWLQILQPLLVDVMTVNSGQLIVQVLDFTTSASFKSSSKVRSLNLKVEGSNLKSTFCVLKLVVDSHRYRVLSS